MMIDLETRGSKHKEMSVSHRVLPADVGSDYILFKKRKAANTML